MPSKQPSASVVLQLKADRSYKQAPAISSDAKAAVKDAQTGVNSAVDKFVGQF
jgi:hypothetical protein